jgi:hypothetical protein
MVSIVEKESSFGLKAAAAPPEAIYCKLEFPTSQSLKRIYIQHTAVYIVASRLFPSSSPHIRVNQVGTFLLLLPLSERIHDGGENDQQDTSSRAQSQNLVRHVSLFSRVAHPRVQIP